MASQLTANNYIANVSMAVIRSSTPDNIDDANPLRIPEEEMTVDINWMYDYGKHLFNKYVNHTAELAINTSYTIRRDLWNIYNGKLHSNVEAFQRIQLLLHALDEDLSKKLKLSAKEDQL